MTARVYGGMFLWMLKSYYKKYIPDADFPRIREDVKAEYRAMVERTKTLANGDECCNFHVTRMSSD